MMEVAKAYQIIFDQINTADETLKRELDSTGTEKSTAFQNFLIYLMISPYENEKVDLMHRVEANYGRELENNELLSKFLKKLLAFELMPLNEAEIENQVKNFEPFMDATENNKVHLRDFMRQLIQHNLRVIEKYYSKIKITTMARLVGVPEDRAESELCDMVVNKRIQAKINRLAWQVNFQKKNKNTEGVLGDWNRDVTSLLDKVEQTC